MINENHFLGIFLGHDKQPYNVYVLYILYVYISFRSRQSLHAGTINIHLDQKVRI